MRPLTIAFCYAAVGVAAGVALVAQTPPQQAPPPQQLPAVFRGGTVVVPLTVTVVDQQGNPVKDLKASDFTVFENKKAREIVNFFPQEFAALPVPAEDPTPTRIHGKEDGVKPQTRRTFLIVLAYGRIEKPTDALEGAIDLVLNKLLPQDLVAVMAFHRTTVFTRDHLRIAQVLERYKKEHEAIVGEINNYRVMAHAPVVKPIRMAGSDSRDGKAGTSKPPGMAPIPDKILKRIDEIFLGPSPAGGPAATAFIRNTSDVLIGMDRVVPVTERPGQHQDTFGSINKILRDSGENLTDEVLLNTKLKLYAGVEYLRGMEGEKQLVFFSGLDGGGTLNDSGYRPDGKGGTMRHAENTDSKVGNEIEVANLINGVSTGGVARDADEAATLAQRASDARVVVNVIATNGTNPRGKGGGDPSGRVVSDLTGGFYSSVDMATKAVGKIDALSRFSYLLGYTPSNPDLDGTFRDVDVIVNRPGLTVRFRHGYFAAPEPPPLELERMVKRARIETALAYDQQAKDIPLTVTMSQLPRMGIQSEARVDILIGVAPLALELKDGIRTGQLEVQVYCGDAKQAVIGEAGQHFDLTAPEATYQQWLQTGIRRTVRVPVESAPKFIKVVVYDYGSDRVGSAMVTIK